MNSRLPHELTEHTRGAFWGISPGSLLLYNNATITGSDVAWDALKRYRDLTVYVTNFEVGWETYTEALGILHEEWFDATTERLAQHATADTAEQFVLGAAYEANGGVMRLLRSAQEIEDDADPDESLVLSRGDARSIADEEDIALLRSFGVLKSTRKGLQIRRQPVQMLKGSRKLSYAEACWAILARICRSHDVGEISTVVPHLLDAFDDVDSPDDPPRDIDGSLPVYAGDDRVATFVSDLCTDDVVDLFADIAEKYLDRSERLSQTMGVRQAKTPASSPAWPLSDRNAAVCSVASQQRLPVETSWILDGEQFDDRHTLRRTLDDAGIDVSLRDNLLTFGQAYSGPVDRDALEEYETYLRTQREVAGAVASAAQRLSTRAQGSWRIQRDGLLAAGSERLTEITTAPIDFVFSMFDPVYHADEYEIEQYVGDSPYLEDEIRRIRDWRNEQPHDAVTFAEKVREICARPIEDESVSPILRIMSPWINFTVKEYTALFQRLLDNDVQVRLLLRLPDPDDWNSLKNDFLTRLGDTRGNLEIRTYTRYKRFKDHTQLRRHKRGELDSEGDRFVSETGIHGKLFVAGDPEDGAILAGSANLMENSFYYNPEAGLHTRHPEVIDTAIDYFELIWELAEADEIDESVFTGKTNFEFYPNVYRP